MFYIIYGVISQKFKEEFPKAVKHANMEFDWDSIQESYKYKTSIYIERSRVGN